MRAEARPRRARKRGEGGAEGSRPVRRSPPPLLPPPARPPGFPPPRPPEARPIPARPRAPPRRRAPPLLLLAAGQAGRLLQRPRWRRGGRRTWRRRLVAGPATAQQQLQLHTPCAAARHTSPSSRPPCRPRRCLTLPACPSAASAPVVLRLALGLHASRSRSRNATHPASAPALKAQPPAALALLR